MSLINAIITIRSGTAAAAAAANLVLAANEPGWTPDTGVLKIGDGVTPWNSLPNILTGLSAETIDDRVAALLVAGTNIGIVYDDVLNTLTINGAASTRFRHDQTASSATWTVNHNLGFRPQCEVFSPGWVQIEAAILHVTDNQTSITFNTAQTGQAIFT